MKKRAEFLKALEGVGSFRVPKKALSGEKSLYTRVFSIYKEDYEEWDDFDRTLEQFESLYLKDAKEVTEKLGKVIKNFKW